MKTLIAGLLLIGSAAVANVPNQKLGFEDLKMACKDPGKFQNQLAPASIKLECSDKVLKYVPAGQGVMPGKRVITFNVSSDKYTVPATPEEVKHEGTSCPLLKQVEETISLSQEVTCDQIKDYQGSATQLCVSLLDGLKRDNSSAVRIVETGRVISYCKAEGTPVNPGKPGQGMK